ncbi:heat shock factor protein 1 isoform X2 [Neophocaena asiaeorientalis asiaeorientalis]|uniref:Heat shock factor protein 1 isoform X2 n=1 Tax=Neophocaena asiaeorientalis asiaeorientalis TaxID=1706337 RepID=A0A341B236_NEOAA|nr:heat shock factor protein 1 isoform X2 [Neophocaena asiaeorientalis asiaeorientalis]
MDLPVGPGAAGPSNVPAFLTKLWTLVSDPDTDALICWSPSGNSFHVLDQGQFAKEVLPKYFKHSNMASFVRQLNMYGFRKVVHIEQGGLVKPERDDTEFQHPCFLRGQEQLLENIKRKVTSVSTLRSEDIKIHQDSVTKLLTDVQLMKGKQESMDSKLLAMKHENEALWREVASLRQKHAQQQKVVNKLIQFLISLVQSNRILGVKRKIPLMLSDSSSAHSMPKYGRQFSLERLHGPGPYSAPSPAYSGSSLYPPDAVASSGPIISDITELAPGSPLASAGGSIAERPLSSSPLVRVKEEPPSPPRSPRAEDASPSQPSSVVETPLSPTALIDSILGESEPAPAASAPALADAGGRPPSPRPASAPEKCLSVACLDNVARAPQMSGVARLFPCPSSSLHGRVQPGLALSHWGGRRALPELGPLPSRGPDPSPAGSTQPCLVNGRPRPSATGTGPPGLWGPCQHPELPTDRGWPRCCADRPSLRRGQGLLVRSRQAWSFQAGTRGEAGPATAEHGS